MLVDYRTFNGLEYAQNLARELEKNGNTLVRIEYGMVPFCEGKMLPGYRVIMDDGRSPYRSIITGRMVYDGLSR